MENHSLIAPEQYNLVSEVEKYKKDGSRTALIWEDESGKKQQITYGELIKKVNKVGHILMEEGIREGDKVLVMIPRLIEAYVTYLAVLKIGAVVIPCSEMLRKQDLVYRRTHSEAKAVIVHSPYTSLFTDILAKESLKSFVINGDEEGWIQLDERMGHASEELELVKTSRDQIAFLSYTSGTTGHPKGVIHTHGWAYAHLRTAASNWLSIGEEDVVWATAGPGWQKWIWSPFLSVLGSGATGFIYHGKFEAETYLQLIDQHRITVLCCTPTEYRLMAKVDSLDRYSLSSLHSAVSAGEPLNREVIDTFQKYFGVTVRDGYGQTENTLLVGVMKGMDIKPGSMGKPTPGNIVEIIDDEGRICQTGEVGDIAVHIKTPALFKQYYKDPERTAMQFRGDFYITGDKAKKDEDGYFWFEGRRDDIIISSGYTIGPFEVEDALVKHPDVKECAVIGSPDDVRGQVVKAFIVLQKGVDPDRPQLIKDLQDHVKQLTAPYKYPRKIAFVEELPKTISGKIMRIQLRNMETELSKLQ